MDSDSISLLKTVCVAGHARPGYDGDSNARLDKLVDEGLLAIVNNAAAGTSSKTPRKHYQPTEQGRAILRQLSEQGVA